MIRRLAIAIVCAAAVLTLAATGGRPDTRARPAPPFQLIGRFFFFSPSCCSM